MTFFKLILAAFFSGLSLGYAKFYFLGYLSQLHQNADKTWIIQTLGALITFGPCLAYAFASPLASAFQKQRIMRLSGYSASLVMLLGLISGWAGSAWMYVVLVGFVMGIFNPAKNAAVPLQSAQSQRTTEAVNAALGIVYIVGILGGTPLATELVQVVPTCGAILGSGFFALAGFFGGSCSYRTEHEHLRDFRICVRSLAQDSLWLFKNFSSFIIGPSMIWGMASATSLAVTAYAEQRKLGDAVACSLMAVYAVVGVVIGNALTTSLRSVRYRVASVANFLMVAVILAMPRLVENLHPTAVISENGRVYWLLAGSVAVLGLLFGVVTNLIESEYLSLVYKQGKEGPGAAVLSAMTAFFPTLFSGLIALAVIYNWATPVTQFAWLAVLTTISALLITRLGMRQTGALRSLLRLGCLGMVRALLRLRYRISTAGLENVKGCQGLLILPNHPALVDPLIVLSELWRAAQPGPVVLEKYYHLKGVRWLMRLGGAIPMPDMEIEPGPSKRRRIAQGMQTAVERLRAGENVLFYPSGRLMTSNHERLGGTSGVSLLLKEVPDLKVVLVRTRGLYGSIFSKAFTAGISPDLQKSLAAAILMLLKNLIFFAPRRKVTLEIVVNPAGFPRCGSLLEVNHFLEDWYNEGAEDKPVLVSRSWWKEDLPALPSPAAERDMLSRVAPDIQAAVVRKISEISRIGVAEITPEKQLGADLGIDSLAMAELLVWLDQNFEATDLQLSELITVGSVLRAACGETARCTSKEAQLSAQSWLKDAERHPAPVFKPAASIPETFLRSADRLNGYLAMADIRSGILSWAQVKLEVLILARRIRRLEGPYVGVLFPASVGGTLVLTAALLAKKVPVMLNWTAGRRSLEHAIKLTGLKHILTSRAFIDMVQIDLEFMEDQMLFVEDLRTQIGFADKLRGWYESKLGAEALIPRYGLGEIEPDRAAVILFTSGSEAEPKGVPLSHRNILSNIDSGLELIELKSNDTLCSFLPPFHSFGLTIGTLVPLLSGARVIFYPNPNESRRIAAACRTWGVSFMAGTPTFLRSILKAGTKEDFQALRLLIAGAEKVPVELFEMVAKLGHQVELIEGYGITECSPIVSGNRPHTKPAGAGRALRGVELLIVQPETLEPLAEGQQGLILIRGANVFNGYLGNARDPFVTVRGLKWYNSGDLGYLSGGNLIITGRLKRFIKIGGEMISLSAIEETIQKAHPCEDGTPNLALVSHEKTDGSRPQLYLFSTFPASLDQINACLQQAGFPYLVRLSQVFQIPAIPILGTGKTDLKGIAGMLAARLLPNQASG